MDRAEMTKQNVPNDITADGRSIAAECRCGKSKLLVIDT